MKEYIVPETLENAILAKRDSFSFLAGGTEINRLNSTVSCDGLISLKKLNLKFIDKISDSVIKIGSMTTFNEIIKSNLVPDYLKKACMFMSSSVKRNMATIGGNVASCRDDSYLIPTLIASSAYLEFADSSKVFVFDYCMNSGKYNNALIRAVVIRKDFSFIDSVRFSNTSASHAVVTLSYSESDSTFAGVCIKNCGIFRINDFSDIDMINFADDMFGSAEYKKYLVTQAFTLMKERNDGGCK